MTPADARELQEAKQWLADRFNRLKILRYKYVGAGANLRQVPTSWKPEHFNENDAQSYVDYHADRINNAVVVKLARELYDRFVMGGWQPEDSYGEIREILIGVSHE